MLTDWPNNHYGFMEVLPFLLSYLLLISPLWVSIRIWNKFNLIPSMVLIWIKVWPRSWVTGCLDIRWELFWLYWRLGFLLQLIGTNLWLLLSLLFVYDYLKTNWSFYFIIKISYHLKYISWMIILRNQSYGTGMVLRICQ